MTFETDGDDEPCPLCGQPYDHLVTVNGASTNRTKIREDAVTCEQSPAIGFDTLIYVHLP